ncbi:Calcium permeable stress-gated cation channel 1 [Fulvia fulva]|uniref:Calcium permeable stress-gated cation channel 1 n=1 Tax=Passalora fulva TaxID=5499 RepID=A0A9Q8P7W0_PASFU|nr:Calcium permeable stress-gated cation channel 1 [Fulvia fulva]KAK4615788.1 Calcium permeable stress-gated cation channel 1 [Fulvia fulva]KAK4616887.1 Calcium permeable stress-gated cation channel 1 [Fulvia fulva]UJO16529.1 Calcium permeable stress-gated cation channel 1 [Fulvia fulva]WPV18824.1 Calcium permeable stress-gated cation channel 1 [Fulvia fulva]WPV34477.1 Calcium permeable stress-gated cation channel 1 [Fulvia fulva]
MAELFTLVLAKDPDDDPGDPDYGKLMGATDPRATTIQILISITFGIVAFLTFCVLRPRWPGLYAARKHQKDEATALPDLPATLFGWIIPLWKITEQQVLASAGLDAYVFLRFFVMAMKFLGLAGVLSLVVIKPVHDAYPDDEDNNPFDNDTDTDESLSLFRQSMKRSVHVLQGNDSSGNGTWNGTVPFFPGNLETDYLWMYIIFAYLFSLLAIYLIVSETRRVIEVRQEFLGAQTTITDRTIRLSGIPRDMQDEDRVKDFVESLDIGKVDSVVLCRNWKKLDQAMTSRMDTLRRLEEAYTIYLSDRRVERNGETLPIAQPAPPGPGGGALAAEDDESSPLNGAGGNDNVARPYSKTRPQATIRHGFLRLRRHKVDAIDHYEEKLRTADEEVQRLRGEQHEPTPLAFVTLDSVASCQMTIQAVLDPSPLQLIANQSPEPADVIWPNTYLSRRSRMVRSWSITVLIVLLTIFWSALFVPIAGLLNVETIGRVFPGLKEVLKNHDNVRALVNTQLPTAIASLLTVLVPYLYYWLSWYQGMISSGDVELSAISKNFFFTFFNFFVIFTILGTASKFYQIFAQFGDAIRDIQKVAYTLAKSLQNLLPFYTNFIILQGLGLFPFRLLEVGSMSLYPIFLMGAKTPRDYAELVQPPIFIYGFYLPNALLIFIICMVYSVLRSSWQVLLAGFIYFAFGHFVYKYQLLYAMDHRQQTSGRVWGMICDRIFVGMVFFQLATAGQLILQGAVARSVMMVPLVIATIWISIVYGKTYKPLLKFIALRSIKRGEAIESYSDMDPRYSDHELGRSDSEPNEHGSPDAPLSYAASLNSTNLAPERNIWANDDPVQTAQAAVQHKIRHKKPTPPDVVTRFVNPSLVAPLGRVWIADKDFRREGAGEQEEGLMDLEDGERAPEYDRPPEHERRCNRGAGAADAINAAV